VLYFEHQTNLGEIVLRKLETRDLTQIAIFTAMISICALFAIPIGPVPVTLQVFFFLLIPALLGSYKGTLCMALYVGLGLIGLPVFAGGSGGFQSVLSPSFGYLLGYILLAPLVGKLGEKNLPFLYTLLGMIVAIFLLYSIGMIYQYVIMNTVLSTPISWSTIFSMNFFTFLPLDLIKAFGAAVVYVRLREISAIRV
jgi:biotin transport system substrate-specific component